MLKKILKKEDALKFTIKDDFTLLNSKNEIVNMIRVYPFNFDNLRDADQKERVDAFGSFIQRLPTTNIQIFKVDEGANLKAYMEAFDEVISKLSLHDKIDSRRVEMLEQEKIELMQRIINREIKDKYFYLVFTDTTLEKVEASKQQLSKDLEDYGFKYDHVNRFETVLQLFTYLNPITSQFSHLSDIKFDSELSIKDYMAVNSFKVESDRLVDDYIVSDGVYQKILYIQGTPEEVPVGWLASFTNFDDVDYSIHLEKTDPSAMKKSYDKSKAALKEAVQGQYVTDSDRKELQKRFDAIDLQQDKMSYGMNVYEVMMTIRFRADSLETLKEYEKYIKDLAGRSRFVLRQGFSEQVHLFETTAPLGVNKFRNTSYCKLITSDTIGFGFPFIHETLVDDNLPIEIGKTFSDGVVLVDTTKRTPDRPNSNEWISGIAGSGKTTLIMKLIYDRFARGEKQFIIDVVGEELKRLVNDLDGTVIDSSSNKYSMINPLQVRLDINEVTEDGEIDLDNIYPLALHIFFLRQFFHIYLGSEIPERRLIINYIEEIIVSLYSEYGINMETTGRVISSMKPEDFPTFKDLYDYTEKMYQKTQQDGHGTIPLHRMESCLIYIKGLGVGADSTLFNGYTNVDLDASLTILFDLSKLQGRDNTVLAAQYYNIISFVWGWITANGNSKVFKRIYGDEIHAMLNPDQPDLSKWMRKISKENRKFFCGLTVATQELADALKGDSSTHGSSILANSVYQFFFMADNETRRILEAEDRYDKEDLDFLERRATRGQCLFRYGLANMRVKVEIGYLLSYFESLKNEA